MELEHKDFKYIGMRNEFNHTNLVDDLEGDTLHFMFLKMLSNFPKIGLDRSLYRFFEKENIYYLQIGEECNGSNKNIYEYEYVGIMPIPKLPKNIGHFNLLKTTAYEFKKIAEINKDNKDDILDLLKNIGQIEGIIEYATMWKVCKTINSYSIQVKFPNGQIKEYIFTQPNNEGAK